jgi:hypothetical protein
MKLLRELADQLLLGTDRRPPVLPALPPALAELLGENSAESESVALRAAGALAWCADAGFVSVPDAEAPACADAETASCADLALVPVLRAAFEEGPDALRVEALRLLAACGLVLPPRLLPAALGLGFRTAALRPVLMPVLGERGRWLARQNPDWAYAVGAGDAEPAADLWEHGSTAERQAFLAVLRQRAPDRARELLRDGFAELDARTRAGLLGLLAAGLSAADEEFLQGALADRSKEVRQIAAGLLARLPTSAYVGRMTTRLTACLRRERKLLRQVWLIEPPESFGADWKADVVEESRAKGESLGDRAWWLYQLARAVPLAWWEATMGMEPGALVVWAKESDWGEALFRAWGEALQRQPEARWAAAFLDAPKLKGLPLDAFDLIACLPVAEGERRWLHLLRNRPGGITQGELVARIVRSLSTVSEDFARHLLDELRQIMARPAYVERGTYEICQALPDFVCLLPLACLDDAMRGWPGGTPETEYFSKTLARMLAIAEQRKTLHRHLSQRKSP